MQITRFGGPEVFREAEVPSPPLTPDGVRIETKAAGVNFADLMMRIGLYPEAPKPPFTPGYEISGVVKEVGDAVRSFRPGDRVLAACRFGGYASEVTLPEALVRMTPSGLSDEEAAAVPVAFMTAGVALNAMARVRESDRVLIPGAAGGVGTAMIQTAVRKGAAVIGLVGSESKKDIVRSLGARDVYTYTEWESKSGAEAGRFDVIADPRGGSASKASLRLLAPGGRLVSYGVSSMVGGQRRSLFRALSTLIGTPILTPIGLAMANKGVFGLNMLTLFDSDEGTRLLTGAMDDALEGFAGGAFRVILGRSFPLGEAGEAQEYVRSRRNVGKVVLLIGP